MVKCGFKLFRGRLITDCGRHIPYSKTTEKIFFL